MNALRILVVVDGKQDDTALTALIMGSPLLTLIAAVPYTSALDVIAMQDIEVVVLDIDGAEDIAFDLAGRLQRRNSFLPAVILTASDARYAVRAFDVRARDYIVKPLNEQRFTKSVEDAADYVIRRQLAGHCLTNKLNGGSSELAKNRTIHSSTHASRIVVREAGRIQLIKVENIDIVEADGRDCLIHYNRVKHRIVGPLRDLAGRFSADSFVQISRSMLVNTNRIVELQEMCKGHLIAVMKNGHELPISRRFKSHVLRQLTSAND